MSMEASARTTLPAGAGALTPSTSAAGLRAPARRPSLWGDAWRRLARNRLALAGGVIVLTAVFVALGADVLAPRGYNDIDYGAIREFPSARYPLGTDLVGRDMVSRMIHGARVSILVGLVSQVIVVLLGVPIGALAGYHGGKVDAVLMRFVDVMYAFPNLLFVILVMSLLGKGLVNIFIALGLTSWVTIARLTRAEFLSLREREFIAAARAIGASPARLILHHLLPNALSPIIVAVTFGVPAAIFTEAALSFIGVGINPPMPSWGNMVGDHQQYIRSYWHLAVFPSAAIGLLMLGFIFLGDGLRDALDPRAGHR
jgi:ABC-type dipeptide/oligopeptide/nickel transport system permease subunit